VRSNRKAQLLKEQVQCPCSLHCSADLLHHCLPPV
jgi:hypothetical protein